MGAGAFSEMIYAGLDSKYLELRLKAGANGVQSQSSTGSFQGL